jgi:hypothetical protein
VYGPGPVQVADRSPDETDIINDDATCVSPTEKVYAT